MLTRRFFLAAALLLNFAAGPASAQGDAAMAFVDQLADRALSVVSSNEPAAAKVEDFKTLFVENFDMDEVARFVLGRYWKTANETQQREFLEVFTDLTVLTWTQRFIDYSGQGVDVEPLSVQPDGAIGFVVASAVKRPGQQDIPIAWRLRRTDGGFQVLDLVVEGVSMAITYRSEYASVIRSQGGTIDGLITAMRKKVDQLQANINT